jgi:peroxiredoxin
MFAGRSLIMPPPLAAKTFVRAMALLLCCSVLQLHGQEEGPTTASSTETNPAKPAPGHSVHGEPFNEGPRHQAHLMAGQGKVNFPVTTANSEAQAFINQGVAQLHTFYYFESERSFRQAAKLDPACAMAYWGMAMSNVNNPKRARGFVLEARKRSANLSRREVLYIDALEGYFKEGESDKSRRQNLLLGLETIVQEFPDDLDARAWLAMVTWQNGGPDGIGSRQAVDSLIETVLEVEPMHPGAHHYRIHLWDGVKPERAERSASLYASAAPGIAHAWHMPGHTFTGLKRYADAAYQQEGSARVDHAYMIHDRVMPFEIHNYAHNNQWFCTSCSHVGRVRDAIAVARNLVEQPRDPQKNNASDGGSPQRSGRIRWAEVLTRYELWNELIDVTTSGALDWSNAPIEQVERAYTLGQAYAATGDHEKLAEQIEALKKIAGEEAKKSKRTESRSSGGQNPWDLASTGTKAALAELQGYDHLSRGEIGPAFEEFSKATSMRPEALARAHLTSRNFGFAESVARDAVKKNPNQVPPLAALVEILHAVDKDKDSQEVYARLVSLAKWADRDLPVFKRIEAITNHWKQEASWTPPGPEAQEGSSEATINRIDLNTVGPLVWSPFPAMPLGGTDTTGKSWNLADLKSQGKSVLVIFFLGGKCAHCMQQLQLFGGEYENLRKLNVETLAISTDDAEATRELKNNPDGVKFPIPMLPDPKLDLFRRYEAFDDFENQPLHGTFLIDPNGHVRFQRVSADPFLEVEFIKTEAARVNRLLTKRTSHR